VIVLNQPTTQQYPVLSPIPNQPSEAHKNNKRESTKDKHETGEDRTSVDKNHSEKGDKRRRFTPGKKGPKTQAPKNSPEYLRPGPKPKKSFVTPDAGHPPIGQPTGRTGHYDKWN
jgi:hypothetical protein